MRQGPALPAHFAGVEEEDRPVLAQIAFDPHAGNVLRRERIVALQPEGGIFIRRVGIEVTVGGHMNPVVTASFEKVHDRLPSGFRGAEVTQLVLPHQIEQHVPLVLRRGQFVQRVGGSEHC